MSTTKDVFCCGIFNVGELIDGSVIPAAEQKKIGVSKNFMIVLILEVDGTGSDRDHDDAENRQEPRSRTKVNPSRF